MAKARAIIKRRKAVDNIRKITRTMELIATNRFRKALNRATEAEAYTRKIAELVADLGETSGDLKHPLLTRHDPIKRALLLVITSNRGLAGGYNGNVLRATMLRHHDNQTDGIETSFEVAGKRGIGFFRFRKLVADATYTQFEDRPQFHEIEVLAEKYIKLYVQGSIDRFDVAYTRFLSSSRQIAAVQTLLPIVTADLGQAGPSVRQTRPAGTEAPAPAKKSERVPYEFLPDPGSILEEIVPVSFKVRLFKCFLDAGVSEQIARRVAMKAATENAGDLIKSISQVYNRTRQANITKEISELIAGSEALK